MFPNSLQADLDRDGEGDECDNDIDSDEVLNEIDACPTTEPGRAKKVNSRGC
jgi:hypothetical protein